MACNVCIGSEPDCYAEFYSVDLVKARKPHKCYECRMEIPVGAEYMKHAGKWDGDFCSFTICLLCSEIASKFACDDGAAAFGTLWEEMRDYAFPELTTASECFAKLSPQAKQFVLDRWVKWKLESV